MPDPNVSDRERLLRLIDGGPDVVKEVQQERQQPAEKKPVAVVPASAPKTPGPDIFVSLKTWWKKSGLTTSSVIKLSLAMLLLIFAIRSFTELVQTMGKKESASIAVPAPLAATAGRELDELGIGLRLVGVDWGETPVALLEDLKTGKTYFAKKNDKIKDLRVHQITKDKVLASYRGKNVELR